MRCALTCMTMCRFIGTGYKKTLITSGWPALYSPAKQLYVDPFHAFVQAGEQETTALLPRLYHR